MEEVTYPGKSHIEVFGGIPQNHSYEYVSNAFLNGLVNYGRNHVAFLLARYGLPAKTGTSDPSTHHLEVTEEVYQKYADEATAGMHFKVEGDDWLILYETDTSYFFLWYDQDCSDCCIERYSIESCASAGIASLEEFVEERIALFKASNAFPFTPPPTFEDASILVRASNSIKGWIAG